MQYCSLCGAEIPDGETICPQCGTPVDSEQSTGKKGSAKKLVRLLGGVLVGAAVTVGAVFGIQALSPAQRLKRSFEKSGNALVQMAEKQSNLKAAVKCAEKLIKSHRYQMNAEIATEEMGDIALSLQYAGPQKKLAGSVQYGDKESPSKVLFAVKNSLMQFELPNISWDVYGFSLKELKKTTQKVGLSSLVGEKTFSSLPTNIFKVVDGKVTLLDGYWDKLWKNAKVENLGKRNGMQAYRLTVSVSDIVDSKTAANSKLVQFLENMDPSSVCYIDDRGRLAKMEIVVVGNVYTIELNGSDAIWDSFSVVSVGDGKQYNGKVLADGTQFAITVDGEGKTLLFLRYDESTGKYEFETANTSIAGYFTADNDSFKVSMQNAGEQAWSVEFGKLKETPKLLSTKYINLLKLNIKDIIRQATILATSSDAVKKELQSFGEVIDLAF